MWDNFDPYQPWYVVKHLNSPLSQSLGSSVLQIKQQKNAYVLKYLNKNADVRLQQRHQQEMNFYHQYRGQDWLIDTVVLDPHLVVHQAHVLEEQPNCPIFVFPYVTLFQPNHAFIVRDLISICDSVLALHDFGYVHGDLKPQHIRLGRQRVQLIDFGQVQPVDSLETVMGGGGTPAYMAPELFLGQPKSIQSDIYALGIMFYEYLMGYKPFRAQNYQNWAIAHCQMPVPLLAKPLQHYQNIIDLMLVKHKQYRISNLRQVKQLLLALE